VTKFCLEVSGEYACFTRPELKVERMSYEVITPSAARAIFESILWKPSIAWQVTQVDVLEPIRWMSLRRNEVGSKISTRVVQAAMRGGAGALGLYVDEDRQQRASLLLRHVRYRIHATLSLSPGAFPDSSIAKYAQMFRRRATRGQCVSQPYLGTREFDCRFRLIDDPSQEAAPIDETRDLGLMLYDLDFAQPSTTPMFFRAVLDHGTVQVPARDSEMVLR
jgi:CRISPR-associated protein Cas5d